MISIKDKFSWVQVKALLKKDALVRVRQPWMTIVQFLWPCIIFVALYSLRGRFQPSLKPECQFQSRELPTKDHLLSFFHSYICSIENSCIDSKHYEEYATHENAPLKPVLNIVQTFLSEDALYKTIVELPDKANFVGSALAIVTNSKFSFMEKNINDLVKRLPEVEKMVGTSFDIKKLFADNQMFTRSGNIICGKPFPRSNNIRYVNNILTSEDLNGANPDELNAMPTPYCKQLYLDVNNNNFGKITWSQIMPIIQGKIIYGPETEETKEIISYANQTFVELDKLLNFTRALNTVMVKLRTDEKFKAQFYRLLELVKSPLVQQAVGGAIDINMVEQVAKRIATDPVIADVIRIAYNILECFAVDRFVPVDSEEALEKEAFELRKKKLFYAGIYFDKASDKDIVYKFRMDVDNSPPTIENRNRFWFPGPDGNFELDMRYHRGFVQVKHAVDVAIIKAKKKAKMLNETSSEGGASIPGDDDWFFNPAGDDSDDDFNFDDEDEEESTTTPAVMFSTEPIEMDDAKIAEDLSNSTKEGTQVDTNPGDTTDATLTNTSESATPKSRRKRQIGGGGFFDLLLGTGGKKSTADKFEVDGMLVHTKQFPYPEYTKDDFKTGLYLAQSVQMAFFIALIVQIATCTRYRIWMKESHNTMLMRAMGLKESSEIITWLLTTLIELAIVFILCCFILYTGAIMQYTSLIFLFLFLVLFGLCVISFCYMCSSFFNSASIGSVSSSILFLISFLPYIIVISLGATLSGLLRFITNLSFTTAFCYAWNVIMRLELQGKGMSVGGSSDSEFRYAVLMMILDFILYAVIGYLIERTKDDEFKFHTVPRDDLDLNVGCVLENVSKIYPPEKVAVSNVSIVFPKDNITCLLGRNGAGKSTLIKTLTGQIIPTSGHVALSQSLCDGLKMDQIGLCCQENILIPQLTAREHLEMYARIKLDGGFELEVARTMKSLRFGKYENYEAYKLSGGYQRRLCVAIAFIGSPNLVILDEPCSGVDTKARKTVWELVEQLRKGRAVVLATHYLDEAEYLGDSVVIMNQGRVIAEHSPESLKRLFTEWFELTIVFEDEPNAIEIVQSSLLEYTDNSTITQKPESRIFEVKVPYVGATGEPNRCAELIEHLENLRHKGKIRDIAVSSKNLEEVFNSLNKEKEYINGDVDFDAKYEKIDLSKNEQTLRNDLPQLEIAQHLLWKRLKHFRRNYRLLACTLLLPAIFEIIAMGFLQIRPEGDHDKVLNLSKALYSNSAEFLSYENGDPFGKDTHELLMEDCRGDCHSFGSSNYSYSWLLDSFSEYHMNRYGGISFNDSQSMVWYNNKGYHSMMAWLNDLNTHMFRAEMNDSEYSITTLNHPIKLGVAELSQSSILQQVADSGISLIVLIAFSLVVAGGSIFIVNERVNGEKLQQMLCGVKIETYWGVAFLWDTIVYLIAILLCVIIFEIFAIPMYVAKSNLDGICLLLFLYGFASIPAVHLFEKLFSEASFANMTIFCLNVVIALTTTTVIVLFDVLGDSDEAESWRNFINRAFLIFPQHALSDGLVTICKNYFVSEVLARFYINTYKSPVTSDLLQPHFIALFVLGVIFIVLNYAIEGGHAARLYGRIFKQPTSLHELQIVSIQNSLKKEDKYNTYNDNVLKVENVSKIYGSKEHAVRNVSFEVVTGECFGLLGNNGAGKSTIFKMLSGQMSPTSGTISFYSNNISYCPQTSALDPLLTVKEVIEFYGALRRVQDISRLISSTLKSFHLEDYKDVLVKNLSGGNRRKLNVAVACFGDTNTVLMDEPTSDMDPVTRSLVYHSISELISERRSVVLTSHTISEIDRVCNRIAVLKDGKLITTGTPEYLKEQFGGYYCVTIYFDKVQALSVEREITQEFSQCHDVQVHPHSLKFVVKVKLKQNDNQNNEIVEDDGCLTLSELVKKLSQFSEERSISYTINKCKLDKVFENILDANDGGYDHKGYIQTETTA